ncbi:hypothetical protein [Thalassococcus lentus]|uniref:Uncharacterized protein n=1 Tax=Thalassococcus lentus TaxID=1210524 RepID=A0ABT4XXB6_9RHOB|nr:hypothetical protein [Thalassococcus lentus]MDA7426608.1 hypothetical protein [Thalassococcus lentus]
MRHVFLFVATLSAVSPAYAEIVESSAFRGEVQRKALAPMKDGTAMTQAFVAVSTKTGTAPTGAQQVAAGHFAAAAGCRGGTALSTIVAKTQSFAIQFEVLCMGGQ